MTLGNEVKGQASILQNNVIDSLKDLLFSESKSDNTKASKHSIEKEHSNTAKNMLHQYILQKQALLTPFDLLKTKIESYNEFLIKVDIAQKEAESQLDYDLMFILYNSDQYAYRLKNQALLQILRIVEKGYFDNYYECAEEVQYVLKNSLKQGTAQVMAPYSRSMDEYVEEKYNYVQECYLNRIISIIENIHQQTALLFGLHWEGEIEKPSLTQINVNYNKGNEPIDLETSLAPLNDELPQSILNPLVLKEIKMCIPVEIEKNFEVLHYYYQDYLQEISCELKKTMRTMLEEVKNHIQLQVDRAVKQWER